MKNFPFFDYHKTVRKYVSIPNCLTIVNKSYKNCFQYAGIPLTDIMNETALYLATKLSIVPIKLFLIVPTMILPGLILCIAKFIDERKWYYSYTDLSKNI